MFSIKMKAFLSNLIDKIKSGDFNQEGNIKLISDTYKFGPGKEKESAYSVFFKDKKVGNVAVKKFDGVITDIKISITCNQLEV